MINKMATIKSALEIAIDRGTINCAVCGVVNEDNLYRPISVGTAGLGSDMPFQVDSDTIFDVASVTKTVPVSTLALIALDMDIVTLDTKLIELLPEYSSPQRELITFRHLLTQTLDFDFAMSGLKDLPSQDVWSRVLSAPLKREPGSHYFYCNATSLLLGASVERIFGGSLDAIAKELIFNPLDMNSTQFRVKSSKRVVPTEIDNWRGREIRAEIHDESSWRLNEIMVPGAAGLFTTASDLQKYLKMIISGGAPLFSDGFLDGAVVNHLPKELNQEAALGFEYNQPYMGKRRSTRTIGKTGFTGSVIVADYQRKIGFTLLTDFTWPKRKESKEGIVRLRQEIADIVWSIE